MPYAYTCELQIDSQVRNFVPGTLSLENIGLGRQILRFVLIHEVGGVAFTRAIKKDHVLFMVNGQAAFEGIVWTVSETRLAENVGIRQTVECTDYGKLSEKVPINEPHGAGTLQSALDHIAAQLSDHGISAAIMPDPGPSLPDMLWGWLNMRQVIEMVSTTSGWMPKWAGTQLTYVEPGSTPAPFTIDDTDPNWLSLTTGSTLETKWNGVWGRYGPRGQIVRTETLQGDGSTIVWTLESPLIMVGDQVTPSGLVTVHRTGGDSQETTDAVGFPGYGPGQWHYNPANNTLTQNTGASTILASGESVDIQYTGDSPGAVFALDEADYIENGPFLTIIDNPNIELRSQAVSWIEGKLQELVGDEEKITVVTDRFGLEPFQALLVDVEDFLVNGDHLILKTQMQHVARVTQEQGVEGVGYHRFTWLVEAVLGNVYRANWERFFRPNAGNPGTGGAVLYSQPSIGGCAGSTGIILHSDNWNSAIDPWSNWPDNDEGAGIEAAADDLELVGGQIRLVGTGLSAANRIGKDFEVQFFEGCVEFSYMAASGLSSSSTSQLIDIGGPGSANIYVGPFITINHIHNGVLDEAISLIYETNFGTITAFTSAAGVISTSQMDVYRLEFKLSYSNIGYLRLFKNGVSLFSSGATLDWPGSLAVNGGFRAVRVSPKGTLDNFTLRVLDATSIPSASVSPSSSASASISPSASVSLSPSPGNSASLSPSASASPSVSPSPSLSPSSSPSRSPSPSASLSPSASISPSAAAGFPSVLGIRGGFSNPASATHPIVVPSVQVGDLIVVEFTCNNNPTISISSGTDWEIEDQRAVGGNGARAAIVWKIADGSDTLTLGTSSSQLSSHLAYRIAAGTFNPAAPLSLTATVFTATPNVNPGSHTPPNGALNYLWLATYHGDSFIASAPPSGYDSLRTAFASGGAVSVACAELESNAASENPGAWTNTGDNVVAYVIAIEPV